MMLHLYVLVLCLSFKGHAFDQVFLCNENARHVQEQCQRLKTLSPNAVGLPNDDIYAQGQANYWSERNADPKPACRLLPASTKETSDLVRYLHDHQLDFAIVNGGHSANPSASNLGAGITLDLSRLDAISLADDHKSINIDTGARWRYVYEHLDPCGVSVAGARAGSVGVGGFLLGGGVSLSAPQYGWSCDSVLSMEVVLANGSILHADHDSHPDLFTALKGGGSNFGIPTKFVMKTFPLSTLQVAFLRFERHQLPRLVTEVSEFTRHGQEDDRASLELSVTFDQHSSKTFAILMVARSGELSKSHLVQHLLNIPHSSSSVNTVTPSHLAHDVEVNNPEGYRQHRNTMTIRNEEWTCRTILDAFEAAFAIRRSSRDREYRPAFLVQPISKGQLGRAKKGTGNLMGLDDEEDSLLLLSFEIRWSDASHDDFYIGRLDHFLDTCRSIATKTSSLHPFTYINYAAAGQDVFQSLHGQTKGMDGVKAVQRKYDPSGYLDRHLSHPFKLHG